MYNDCNKDVVLDRYEVFKEPTFYEYNNIFTLDIVQSTYNVFNE